MACAVGAGAQCGALLDAIATASMGGGGLLGVTGSGEYMGLLIAALGMCVGLLAVG